MKEFLKQCLEDLDSLTDIKQYHYLLYNDPEGEKKVRRIIEGMLITCKQFDYIPEEAQKKIISDQMVKDQDYKQLDSRTIYKWLNANGGVYWAKSNEVEHFEGPVAPMSEATQKMVKDFLSNLAASMEADKRNRITSGKTLKAEMDKIVKEDEIRAEGIKSRPFVSDTIKQRKAAAAQARGLDKLGLHELKEFKIEGEIILARTLEEAQEIYLEII